VNGKRGLLDNRLVSEDDAIEVLEFACDESRYGSYGLSVVGGKNKLTGPGIPVLNDDRMPAAGGGGFITMTGGMWPKRLRSRCIEIVDIVGEQRLVQLVLANIEKDIAQAVCPIVKDCSKKIRSAAKGNETVNPPEDVLSKLKSDLSNQQRITGRISEL
jgi:hypothetical protein